MIKAVLFDVDGVLIDSKNNNVALYQNVLQKAGYPKPERDEVLAGFHMSFAQNVARIIGNDDSEVISKIVDLAKNPDLMPQGMYIFPASIDDTLVDLSSKYKLGVVTGRMDAEMQHVFREKDIKDYFDTIIVLEHYKRTKPDPEPLLLALEHLEILPEEAIYIGDSHTDIEAAKAAGMRSIHLNDSKHPDAEIGIKDFSEVLKAIDILDK